MGMLSGGFLQSSLGGSKNLYRASWRRLGGTEGNLIPKAFSATCQAAALQHSLKPEGDTV